MSVGFLTWIAKSPNATLCCRMFHVKGNNTGLSIADRRMCLTSYAKIEIKMRHK